MDQQNSTAEIFFKFLSEFQFNEKDLDYTVVENHIKNTTVNRIS